jgi:hypothetical protein
VVRDKNHEPVVLGSLEDTLYVLDGLVFFNAVADEFPSDAFLAQKIVLRVGNQYRRIVFVDFHGSFPLVWD